MEQLDIAEDRAFIICENLVKIYKVADLEVVALQGLDLRIERGELIGIVGNSGSGKSTLLNILGGLDRPSAGRVTVDGQDLLKMSDRQLANYRLHSVGFLWQQVARNLIPYLSAKENVELPMIAAGSSGRKRSRHAQELLEALGMEERIDYKLVQLSGGEQQRVAIAVAMANSPSLLLADEPTGELDSENAEAIYSSFRRLNQLYGTTIIIVTHDRTINWRVDRVIQIRDGKTSTETVRRIDEDQQETHDEYIVLDPAGRLQVPAEFLEQFGMKDRVKMELTEDGIIIRPPDYRQEKSVWGNE